jgi:hypothetical protein
MVSNSTFLPILFWGVLQIIICGTPQNKMSIIMDALEGNYLAF